MFGQDGNRPKRDPKEIKHSDRKLVSQKDLDAAKGKTGQGGAKRQSSTVKRAAIGGSSLLMTIIAIVLYLVTGQSVDLGSLGDIGALTSSGGGAVSNTLQAEADVTNLTPAAKKPYTIMVYMNGTDLESNYGCATGDLQEMAYSEFDPEKVNLIILTGGTKSWKNSVMSNNTCIYQMTGSSLQRLSDLGRVSIADTAVLKDYVDFGVKYFPADKYGFIFWNHGGGTIHGYGSDQNFNGASMSVSEIETAFSKSAMTKNKFEFIGFDCCLMGTIEIAYLLEPYANYMIASEETEPGQGWDYRWLKQLSDNPTYTGDRIGRVIVDTFVDYYESRGGREQATLSVVDLSKTRQLSDKFEAFMDVADDHVSRGGFNTISQARKGTKSYGYTGQDRSSFDLVDIKHLAQNLQGQFRSESSALISAVENAVVYYKNSKNVSNSYGISTYIPYAAKEMAPPSVQKYNAIGILPQFREFLANFTQKLTGKRVERSSITRAAPYIEPDNGDVCVKLDPSELEEINAVSFVIWRELEPNSDYFIKLGLDTDVEIDPDGTIKTGFDGYWATLGGQTACFYEVERADDYIKYSTPAILNGTDVNLMVLFSDDYPNGRVLGAIPPSPEGGAMAPKYLEEIKQGDTLALKYFAQLFLSDEADYAKYDEAELWVEGESFTVNGELEIEIVPVDDELYLYGYWIEDTQGNSYYTDFIEIRY